MCNIFVIFFEITINFLYINTIDFNILNIEEWRLIEFNFFVKIFCREQIYKK